MKNNHFQFKQFTVWQQQCAMKVCTDACLFGAWAAEKVQHLNIGNILDIGTGTGLLSLMVAQKTHAAIDAVESDGPACQQARDNIYRSAWSNRIQVVQADVKQVAFQKTYDLIISNPPFYEHDLCSPDEPSNAARHSQGLTLHQLMSVSAARQGAGGYLAVLLPYQRTGYFQALAAGCHYHLHAQALVRHSPLHPFFRSFLLLGRQECTDPQTEEIMIRNGDGYSEEFTELLKDYYLYL